MCLRKETPLFNNPAISYVFYNHLPCFFTLQTTIFALKIPFLCVDLLFKNNIKKSHFNKHTKHYGPLIY